MYPLIPAHGSSSIHLAKVPASLLQHSNRTRPGSALKANDRIDKHPYLFVSLGTKRHRRRTDRITLLRHIHFATPYRAAPYLSRSRQTSTTMNRPGRMHPHDLILPVAFRPRAASEISQSSSPSMPSVYHCIERNMCASICIRELYDSVDDLQPLRRPQ